LLPVSSGSASLARPCVRFQPPPRRTERAVFPHSALLPASRQGLCDQLWRQRFRRHAPTPPVPPSSAFPLAYIPRLRSCRSWVLFSGHPCLPCCRESYEQQGPFAPRALPRFHATTSPSATLSSSADFPVLPVIRPTQLPPFRAGTRRVSPVARCILVVVPSLTTPPERSAASIGCDGPCCLRPHGCGLGLRDDALTGPPRVHHRYGPTTRTHPR